MDPTLMRINFRTPAMLDTASSFPPAATGNAGSFFERSMSMRVLSLTNSVAPIVALVLAGCGGETLSAGDLNDTLLNNAGSSGASTAGGGQAGGTVTPTAGAATGGGGMAAGGTPSGGAGPDVTPTGGTGNAAGAGPDIMPDDDMGTAGAVVGDDDSMGLGGSSTMDPLNMAGTSGDDTEVPIETGPYAPRTGDFKMLVYSRTAAFRHDEAIAEGKRMLEGLGPQLGFAPTFTEKNDDISVEGLSQYEVVFFLCPTGDIFNNAEQNAFEEWMTMHDGAFVGVHSATDTENGWAFYSEVTGQYYNGHDNCCNEQAIEWDADATDFVAVKGMPTPWRHADEYYKFDQALQWQTKPGFKILGRVTTNGNQRPVSYVREWENFRSFYTSVGHQGAAYRNADVIKHVTAGILWAARREALVP